MLAQANLYQFTDDTVATEVRYSTTSALGPPQFVYLVHGVPTEFTGDQIETRATALGDEVTVTLQAVAGDHTTTLTVLIPTIMVATGDRVLGVHTLGVLTTTTTTSAGPPPGVSQTYVVLQLRGQAKQVVFSPDT